MRKILLITAFIFFLVSCGGGSGDSGGNSSGTNTTINILGDWNQVFTLTDCGSTQYIRLITFFSLNGNVSTVGTMRDQGEFPIVRGGGICDMSSFSKDYDFSSYPSDQDSTQFQNMFSLKTGWVYKTLTVTEFTNNKITLVRELADGRVWTYVFTR